MAKRTQRGQALAEMAIAAPLLVLLLLGLLQLGQLLWLRVKLQAAAQAAARAYTVHQPADEMLAREKARTAAWLAMRPQPRGARVLVRMEKMKSFDADGQAKHATWLNGALAHRMQVVLELAPPAGLRWLWPQGLSLQAPVSILTEQSLERHAADK